MNSIYTLMEHIGIQGRVNYEMDLDLIFKKLIQKQITYQSDNLGLNLLISRLQLRYSNNRTEEELERCLQDCPLCERSSQFG